MNKIIIILINTYQKIISPFIIPSCRYYPSCSEYSKSAFLRFGFFRAIFFTIKRILRCNPFGGNGLDPLPRLEE
ncbi:MAG: membrane protein insertion efficiency factor YidD [Deltaproteobacteria bacterium RIFCSPHIGHO2_12_FULL_43_9]|nr:MAG: membrane protein insertion efficiency factor YidD [Deltaproteobacteria bacterium RIFCSPHIGHO2_12_FULL_43_9]